MSDYSWSLIPLNATLHIENTFVGAMTETHGTHCSRNALLMERTDQTEIFTNNS